MKLSGKIEQIIYENPENGYTVIKLRTKNEVINCVGIFPPLSCGQPINVEGEYGIGKFGKEFKATEISLERPNTLQDIAKYLGSGLIEGIGEKLSERIVDAFKLETFDIIENNPEKLATIKGISLKKALLIQENVNKIKNMQDIIIFLQKYGLSLNMCLKIYKLYGVETKQILSLNPYKLIEDLDGVGFMSADKIALQLGLDPNCEFRFRAGVLHCLKENSFADSNTYMLKTDLFSKVNTLLKVENELLGNEILENVITRLKIESVVKEFTDENQECIALSQFYFKEKFIAEKVVKLKNLIKSNNFNIDFLDEYEKSAKIILNIDQKNAIKLALDNGISIITGGPGTGKTTIVKGILHFLKKQNYTFSLMAPTGRASKRMQESTGENASTIHRALELKFINGKQQFSRNESNPLPFNFVIVDEASMIDCVLMFNLLKAIGDNTRLIIVGDADQLPSVGAGNVLKDLLDSKIIPFIKLEKIYRQSEDSLIITNAHLINEKHMPIINNSSKDFFFEEKGGGDNIAKSIIEMASVRIPKFLNTIPSNIQVLAPMKIGLTGINYLNEKLQEKLNQKSVTKPEIQHRGVVFRLGDRVMQTANDYEQDWVKISNGKMEMGLGVFNGDIGIITKITYAERKVEVLFEDGRTSIYTPKNLDNLTLSYAITIHKSQGCEFDVVIIPLIMGAPKIITKNLLYTAVTRAKKMVVLVGEKRALQYMTHNTLTTQRLTRLKQFLKESMERFTYFYGEE